MIFTPTSEFGVPVARECLRCQCTQAACKAVTACKHRCIKLSAFAVTQQQVNTDTHQYLDFLATCKLLAQVPIVICFCCHRARTLHPGSTQSRHSVPSQAPEALPRLLASARHSRRIESLPAQAPAQQLVSAHVMTCQVRLVKPADTTA